MLAKKSCQKMCVVIENYFSLYKSKKYRSIFFWVSLRVLCEIPGKHKSINERREERESKRERIDPEIVFTSVKMYTWRRFKEFMSTFSWSFLSSRNESFLSYDNFSTSNLFLILAYDIEVHIKNEPWIEIFLEELTFMTQNLDQYQTKNTFMNVSTKNIATINRC